MQQLLEALIVFLLFSIACQCYATPRLVYIDLGANDGQSVTSFLQIRHSDNVEISNTDGSKLQKKHFRIGNPQLYRQLGIGKEFYEDNKNWEIVAVEANKHYSRQLKLQKRNLLTNNTVKSYTLHSNIAIGTFDGNITFLLDTHKGPGSAGSSVMNESYSVSSNNTRIVKCLDIVTLLHSLHLDKQDFVILKIDVEGMEYDLAKHLIITGAIRYIGRVAVEWHHNSYFVFGYPNVNEQNYKERLATHLKYKFQYEALMWMVKDTRYEKKFYAWG